MTYAERTEVTPERSRAELERLLVRYGADSFAYITSPDAAAVAFRAHGRFVRFELPVPHVDEFRRTSTGRVRGPADAEKARDAEVRRRWRALVLVVKGKLEAVESEIVTFEEEFLAHLVLPNGQTVGSEVRPMVAQAYETGIMPAFSALALPAGEGS